jgi:hypothetical protein
MGIYYFIQHVLTVTFGFVIMDTSVPCQISSDNEISIISKVSYVKKKIVPSKNAHEQ